MKRVRWAMGVTAALLCAMPIAAGAQNPPAAEARAGQGGTLAKQVSNPVSSLVSVPFQLNWEFGSGARDPRTVLNFQPVMPFKVGNDWNYVVRVIVPVISQPPAAADGETRFGMGDLTVQTFLTPAQPGGVTWAIGPALGLPMGSDPALGSAKWTAGPAALLLAQPGHWTLGMLATQLWSFAGDGGRDEVDTALLQPFVAFAATPTVTLTLNSETSASWRAEPGGVWLVPVQLFASKIVMLGRQPLSVQAGGGWFAAKPDGGPSWRLRSGVTLLVPAK